MLDYFLDIAHYIILLLGEVTYEFACATIRIHPEFKICTKHLSLVY